MKKIFFSISAIICLTSSIIDNHNSNSIDDCNGCKYELEFVKTINNGDDSKYDLRCSNSGNHYDIYKRKNGKWESLMSNKQYEDKCEVVKYLCDCK